ncbi:hypothetical protein Poli38472_009300 [Pythium oligandrum]|uniref:Peptidyl-prolyl cis-trans isomerase n=1 Tax=Pythium oligandrum TaxID=41045 RepID=A0A8K1CLG8_PYTOL|nr:hypothetical protein Poli38472_009300 [Pythium oligandrum]|eukprot:TMW65133.1 hypothetical protein Poli38472_009300 [Pythium oligandrum]
MTSWRRVLLLLAIVLAIATTTPMVAAEEATVPAPVIKEVKAKANHILVDTEEEADEIFAQLEKADRILVDFAKAAKVRSKCQSGPKGGYLGWVSRSRLAPELGAAVFDNEPGHLYKVKSESGWHVVYTIQIGEEEAPDDSTYHTVMLWVNKAMPFFSPVLLIIIFLFGQSRTIKLNGGVGARASHILVDTEAEADVLLKQIKAASKPKEKLEELAKRKSKCPSKSKGGDLGLFSRGQMVPPFEKVAFEEEVGSVHKVQTQFGWHVVMVTDRIGDKKAKKDN